MFGRLGGARATILAGILAALVTLTGCGLGGILFSKSVGDVIQAIDRARTTIAAESTAWRAQLQQLERDLGALESQVAADAKDVTTAASNQVATLAEQAIQLTDSKVQDRIAQAGTEFRCNVDFLKESVEAELQYLVDDLRFWEKEKKRKSTPAVHGNCWVTPSTLSLYPTDDGGWSADSANMSEKGVIHIFGYAYRSEALPTVTLQDLSGSVVRAATIRPAYVTRYQINLDISTETFAGVQQGSRLVLDWPDTQNDDTTITLVLRSPAKLQIQEIKPNLSEPKAGSDSVLLNVKVLNTGDSASKPFHLTWTPDTTPGTRTYTAEHTALLQAKEAVWLPLGPHTYLRSGDIDSTISISQGGGDFKIVRIRVLPPPPPLEGTLHTGNDCDAIDFKIEHNAVPAGQVEFRLQPGKNINWWKAVFVPVRQGADFEPRRFVIGPALVAISTGQTVAFLAGGALTGGYRGFQMQDGKSAGGLIAVADLDRNRPLTFAKAKGWGNHETLAFTWNALSAEVIEPVERARVTLSWVQDKC